MLNRDLKLLDCTLRDGGYINDWKWGYKPAKEIINSLVKANVNVVEVGFLRNVDQYNKDITVCNHIEELNRLLPEDHKNTMFSAMAMRSNYDIGKLSECSPAGIEMIRITAHDYDIREGMEFAKEVKARGYNLSINPINIMGYSDRDLLWIIDQVNQIRPYQFSIVDTFGSMRRRDLDRIAGLVDNDLDPAIRVGLHLHENMAQSFSLAQRFIDNHPNRPITVDGSLMGIGRAPGNLPIELIADYLNEYADTHYDIDYLMDSIQDYIAPIREKKAWGYTPAYFLSAKYNLHRNYSEHYLKKGDLTNRDINHILARIAKSKKTAFDVDYADRLYREYLDNKIDDRADREKLTKELEGKNLFILSPGKTLVEKRQVILEYIEKKKPVVFSVNFVPEDLPVDYAFFSNRKRFDRLLKHTCKIIVTSNLDNKSANYQINHNSISGGFSQGCNSLILLLNLFCQLKMNSVMIAGADGYNPTRENYYDASIRSSVDHDSRFNMEVGKAMAEIPIKIRFLTPSAYESYYLSKD